ncbi:GNAT family N-acetyltransferase [Candidatus Woesearchaeota archaeon]|nr:GNAT family N-acetyltransferase [Candidatus Woesearchaeota archaeon]
MIIRGKSLFLRPLEIQDAEKLSELGDDMTIYKFTHIPLPFTVRKAEEYILRSNQLMRKGRRFRLGIVLQETGELVGTLGLEIEMPGEHKARLFYWMGKPYRGRGYVTEACRMLISYAFSELGLGKIIIRCATDNRASQRVIQKLGGKLEGILRKDSFIAGKWRDALYHGLLKEEWVYADKHMQEKMEVMIQDGR